MSEVKTPEQEAQEVAAAAQAKTDAKAAADAEKARVKAEKDAVKAAAKAEAEKGRAEAKAKKDAEAAAAKALKEQAAAEKAAAAAAKAETKVKVEMPSKNGVRRPKPDGACGKVWQLADELSKELGQPVPIAQLSKATQAAGLNDATTRTQYALWKTFNSVFGPVPKIVEAAPAPVTSAEPVAA
jgi:uncharacterized membrane protein YqiK